MSIYQIFAFVKEKEDTNEKYVLYYYTYNTLEKRVGSPQMEEVR
jgi:hypothetical protein